MGCAKVSMAIADNLSVFAEPADHHVDRGLGYAGVISYLFWGARRFDDAGQYLIARIAVLPGALWIFSGITEPFRPQRHLGERLADREGIPAIMYRSFQTAFPAPDADSIHDRLLKPAVPDQKERDGGFVFAWGVPSGRKRPWTGLSFYRPGGSEHWPIIPQVVEP